MRQIGWMTWVILGLSFPAAWGLRIIGHVLKARSNISLADVARLGSQLRGSISMLGAILSIGVLATASRWQAIAALPGGKSIPSTVVLLFGAVYALALAILYVPVQERWAAVAGELVTTELHRQFRPLSIEVIRGFTQPELTARKELQSALGLGGALSGLQGSLSVLAPVIAAAVSSLFS